MSDPAPAAEPAVASERRDHRSSLRPSLLLAGLVVGLDQLTKHWAVNRLSDRRNIEVVWTLRFHLTFNSGMAFSQAQGLGPAVGVIALVVVVVLLVSLRREGSAISTAGVGLVIGGALGNVLDRLFRGEAWLRGSVVDFIDFQWFPIFNVADIAVNVGGGLLVLSSVLAGRKVGRTS